MPTYEIHNSAEAVKILKPDATVRKLASDFKFTEGPVWIPAKPVQDGFLLFSDIPGDTTYRWDATQGLTIYRRPDSQPNGRVLDRAGRMLLCHHQARNISIEEIGETPRLLVDSFNGKRLNSPNDIIVKSDGTIWFTDPPYGIAAKDRERLREQPKNYVFCLDPKTAQMKIVADDFDMPNGLCFSPDESLIYIADSGKPHHVRVFKVRPDNTLSDSRVFCIIDPGVPDGMRVDPDGRLFSTAGDGVHIFGPDGTLIARIFVPETPANIAFGGPTARTLFITAQKSLYSMDLA